MRMYRVSQRSGTFSVNNPNRGHMRQQRIIQQQIDEIRNALTRAGFQLVTERA